jgi:hypothetical protein
MLRVDKPEAGFYWRRFVRGGPKIPVHIWFGAPLDPVTGEELERGHRWQARVRDLHQTDETDVLETWISCAGNPIPETEYNDMLSKIEHAETRDQRLPEYKPDRKIDLSKMPPIFQRKP